MYKRDLKDRKEGIRQKIQKKKREKRNPAYLSISLLLPQKLNLHSSV